MKSIYTYYKERLIEISGRNRCLYTKALGKKTGYDIGRLLENNPERAADFAAFLWSDKRQSFGLIDKRTAFGAVKVRGDEIGIAGADKFPDGDDGLKAKQRCDRLRREEVKKTVQREIQDLTVLKREIEEIEMETGRYELYVGYPFVYGSISDAVCKAPLLLFPVTIDVIDENTVSVSKKAGENVMLNRAFIYAYAQAKRLKLEDIDGDATSLSAPLRSLEEIRVQLKGMGISIAYEPHKNIFGFKHYPEPKLKDGLEIKQVCVLARYTLFNSIYADYETLEKKRLTNDAIGELLNTKRIKRTSGREEAVFNIGKLDFAQEEVIRKLNRSGNMVIYGPPGTGKSQTIVNVITDAMCKNRRVLVVSQKKAALDVVFNRLGNLSERAMYVSDAEKGKREFYERCFAAHTAAARTQAVYDALAELERGLAAETEKLEDIWRLMNTVTDFGLPVKDMYARSYIIGKNTGEYAVYKAMLKNPELMGLNYGELCRAVEILKEGNKAEIYYNFAENKKKNPFVDHLKADLDIHTISSVRNRLEELIKARLPLFDKNRYPYARQLLAYYSEVKTGRNLKPLVKLLAKMKNPSAYRARNVSLALLPALPFTASRTARLEREVGDDIAVTLTALEDYAADFAFIADVLTQDGYLTVLDYVMSGNFSALKLLYAALGQYVELKDSTDALNQLSRPERLVLDFAYAYAGGFGKFKETLSLVLPIRIYHELIRFEEGCGELSKLVDFENVRTRILSLRREKTELAAKLAEAKFSDEYIDMFADRPDNKDYLYQISKKQNFWPIRKTMEVYGDYLLTLFPCWLLSPENVSTLLPLKKNLFDIVLFDEASQVFIENTLPTIYRGDRIVVAGDAKQLRPTAVFMKRYLGGDVTDDMDYSTQAALEVESLLDLAVSRYGSANLTYHYRSLNEELINFSCSAFYDGRLQVAPNVSKNLTDKPIVRVKVDGRWLDRRNLEEARKVAELIKRILSERRAGETVGVITFNAEQESAVEDMLDKESYADPVFRDLLLKEKSRKIFGEDQSLFIKNIENVQGDERDIIIFSVGYAKNETGRVAVNFGSLSLEGGENRLNVSITRAKKKIIVVTSIEPEELKVENAKNAGPKLFKKYLMYCRAVSEGRRGETQAILSSFDDAETRNLKGLMTSPVKKQLKERLEKLGYTVETDLGNARSRISLAVYDDRLDRYLVGVETDTDACLGSPSVLERDVCKYDFLTSHGWSVVRVWSRDFWLHPAAVVNNIVRIAEKNRVLLSGGKTKKESVI